MENQAQEPTLRELVEKIEAYGFTSEGGPLVNCTEWQKIRSLIVKDGPLTPKGVEDHISQILEGLCTTCIELDAADVEDKDAIHGYDVKYTPEDAMNALHIFSHITGNIRIHTFLASDRTDADKDLFEKNTMQFGGILSELFFGMTGIDPKKYYNDK